MHVCKRDVVDGGDRDCIGDFAGGEAEEFARPGSCRDCELGGVVETLCHYRYGGCEPALDFIGYCECQHEFLARCPGVFGRCKNGPEVVTWVAKPANRHIAIQQIDIAHQT